ncbi:MAG: hypothetical protein JW856_02200 [Dehalococcoidales bacterium]|nr:hypothetical protein [Dehalococcoidales bacterium]
MPTIRNFKLTRQKTIALLQQLEAEGNPATTIYLPAGMPMADIETLFKKSPVTQTVPPDIVKSASGSLTGSALFLGTSQKYLVSPPFPLKENYITDGYDIGPLSSLLARDFTIGIILVRLGSYSIGICRGEKLLEHNTGTGLVHGRHRQGGSSAARFQRRRQDQTHHFLKRAGEHIEERFGPYAKKFDFLVYGGARTTIDQLKKQRPFLQQFENRLLPPLLEIPDPRLNVLEKAVIGIWSSKITKWQEEQ